MTRLEEVRQWVADAVADGWTVKPTYGPHESVETAASLEKKGFKALAVMRPGVPGRPRSIDTCLSVWGPDELAVTPTTAYSWDMLQLKLRECRYCYNIGVTVRIGFAGRCCQACHAKHVKEVERKGWAD